MKRQPCVSVPPLIPLGGVETRRGGLGEENVHSRHLGGACVDQDRRDLAYVGLIEAIVELPILELNDLEERFDVQGVSTLRRQRQDSAPSDLTAGHAATENVCR